MAEVPDPTGMTPVAPPPTIASTAITTEPAPPPPEPNEPYRPLSLLALVGLALAVLFAFLIVVGGLSALAGRSPRVVGALLLAAPVVGALGAVLRPGGSGGRSATWAGIAFAGALVVLGLGGLIAFASSNPWSLPVIVWALPIFAVGASLLALSQIKESEGTLAGADLARWGIRLAIFFVVIYGAYNIGNTFAVRNQAQTTAEEFLDQLKRREWLEAFLRGMPAGTRPSGTEARPRVEAENPMMRTTQPGPYSAFQSKDWARLIALGGTSNQFNLMTFATPEFKDGSYTVEMQFRFKSDLGDGTLRMVAQSKDTKDASGATARKWSMLLPACELSTFTPSSECAELQTRHSAALELVRVWAESTMKGNYRGAYLTTAAVDRRSRLMVAELLHEGAFRAILGIGPAASAKEDHARFQAEIEKYREGKLLDTSETWSGLGKDTQRMLNEATLMFLEAPPPPFEVHVPPEAFPYSYRVDKDRVVIGEIVRIALTDRRRDLKFSTGTFMLEGEVLVEAPITGPVTPETMRLTRFRLLRGMKAVSDKGP